MRQSPELRRQLSEAWDTHPRVRQYVDALRRHAADNGLTFDADGMTAINAFSAQEIADNGPLPDSGILIG